MTPLLAVAVGAERDLVAARKAAREIAALLGLDGPDQVRVATAVSEIARNAVTHAGGGRVEFFLEDPARAPALLVRISDRGPGIADLEAVLAGRGGAGSGLASALRLVDGVDVRSDAGAGTVVTLRKRLPRRAAVAGGAAAEALAARLAGERPPDPLQEVQALHRELLSTLEELTRRQDDLARLDQELEDTNRGVVALYAELDEKADRLRRADELKSRFLSHMSHEFRTPLSSILALTRLLLGRHDGELTREQETQLRLIRKSAEDLTELVNDLLDLAKVEAGKIVVRPAEFRVTELFGALRGVLRPLQTSDAVALVFEAADPELRLYTDESKLAQILRNLVSNALKFTERGEVRVTAAAVDGGRAVAFAVSDTGIGIAPEHQARIFEEFAQLDSPLQRQVKGTGLGLPLSKKLAELLGGAIGVESRPGQGSRFWVRVPTRAAVAPAAGAPAPAGERPAGRVLVVDDDPAARYVVRAALKPLGVTVDEAPDGLAGLVRVRAQRPDAIVLDLMMPGLDGRAMLAALDADPATHGIPVVLHTAKLLDPAERHELAARAAGIVTKDEPPAALAAAVQALLGRSPALAAQPAGEVR